MTMCTHCSRPQRGSSGVNTIEGYHPLCHPDDGLNCYRLVTVFDHPLRNCQPCASVLQADEFPDPAQRYLQRRHHVQAIVNTFGLVQLLYALWCALVGHSLVSAVLYVAVTMSLTVNLYLLPRLH